MTYYPESVPPLDDAEIVSIVDDLAVLHDDFDSQRWEEWQVQRAMHEAEMLGRIAVIKADVAWPRTLGFRDTKIQHTLAEIELQIPPEYSATYREARQVVLPPNKQAGANS